MILEINNLNEIVVKVNEGSGLVLKFEADKKCYILTAYHNIEDSVENNEEIELFHDIRNLYSIVNQPYCDKENDFALLEIEYIHRNIPIVKYDNSILSDNHITFIGYPDKAESKRKRLNGAVIEWNDKTAVNVLEDINGSFVVKEYTDEVIVGFSGSGVFKKDGQKLSLIGILKSLPEKDFDYKEISCVSIEKILKFIQDKNLAEEPFLNPSAYAFKQLKSNDERNLEDKLKNACPTIKQRRVQQYIRLVSLGKSEQMIYSARDISAIKNMIFEECQDELMDFIDSNNDELNFEKIKLLLEAYTKRAKKIIIDKKDEYNYGNFSDDIIKKIILDLIDTCYLSFDEEGIYE